MRRIPVLMAVLLTAMGNTMIPPERYDHVYTGKLLVLRVGADDLNRICKTRTAACVVREIGPDRGRCTIFMIRKGVISIAFERKLRRHERAHCNGWSHRHPR